MSSLSLQKVPSLGCDHVTRGIAATTAVFSSACTFLTFEGEECTGLFRDVVGVSAFRSQGTGSRFGEFTERSFLGCLIVNMGLLFSGESLSFFMGFTRLKFRFFLRGGSSLLVNRFK